MTILSTARLRFEPFHEDHLDGLQAMNRDPEVQRYLLGRPETPEETLASIARVRARWAAQGYSWWALIEHASGELVGAGCIQHLGHDPANPHEIGWRLRRDRWGMGLASEAARELVHYGFEALAAPVLYAVRHPENAGSARVMDKLGMRYVGVQSWGGQEVAVHERHRAHWMPDSSS